MKNKFATIIMSIIIILIIGIISIFGMAEINPVREDIGR